MNEMLLPVNKISHPAMLYRHQHDKVTSAERTAVLFQVDTQNSLFPKPANIPLRETRLATLFTVN